MSARAVLSPREPRTRVATDIDLSYLLSNGTPETLKEIYEQPVPLKMAGSGHNPKRQNVSINVRVNGYDVDLVPAKRHNSYSQDHSLYRRKADTWTKTNITRHISYVSGSGRTQEARIIKLWRNQKALDFPSFYLEVTVINALAYARGSLSDNVWKVFQYLRDDFANARVLDPANTNNVISDDLTATERARVKAAASAGACGNQLEPDRHMTAWSLPQLLAGLHDDIEQRLATARKSFGHPGTKGDASERVWLQLLQTYLPGRYQAETAHVVDSRGAFSDQIDVVVFDRQYSPFIFNFEGQIIIPAESVYAAFEAKQAINAAQVEYAQGKVASVRRLHRTSLPIPHAGGTYDPKPLTPSDDKKCDMLYVDKELQVAVVAQCYMARRDRAAAPANKASDLNTAVAWILTRDVADLQNLFAREPKSYVSP